MPSNINTQDRIASRIPIAGTEIFTPSDFPEAISGVITLPGGTYIISDDITCSNQFVIPAGEVVEIRGVGFGHTLTYSGTDPMFKSVGGALLTLELLTISLTADGAQLFDIDGCSVTLNRESITWTGAGGVIGSVTGAGVQILSITLSQLVGFRDGITVDNVVNLRFEVLTLVSDLLGSGNLITIGPSSLIVEIDRSTSVAADAESFIGIDSGFMGRANIFRQTHASASASQLFAVACLDETSKFVTVLQCPPFKDSKNIGSMTVSGNMTTMAMGTADTWFDLDLDGNGVAGSQIELWSVTDSDTGELRFEGLFPFQGLAIFSVTISTMGGSDFQFRLVKNGSPLPDPLTVTISGTVSGALVPVLTVTPVVPVTADPDDLFRIQILQKAGTSSPVICDVSMVIQ